MSQPEKKTSGFADSFYAGIRWKETRRAFKKSKGGLCELCLKRGLYTPGEIVHHIKPITPDNMDDPTITLNWDNLQLLCRKCHERIHSTTPRRYAVDEFGHVTGMDD